MIYRQRCDRGFSIEGLFQTVTSELNNQVDIIEYELGSRWSIFMDAWKLRKMGADIYHITGHDNYMVFFLLAK